MVAYVDTVTVMCTLLFVLHVCMLKECEGARVTAMFGGVVVESAWHVGNTRIVSSAADVLGMSVVRGMRGVGGVWEMCMCFARASVGGEGVNG